MTPFGEKMRTLRAKKCVKQATMAEKIGVSAAYLSALEHGNRGAPSFALIQKIIEYFGLIWDDAEDLKLVARLSKPKVSIDTAGLDPRATRAANLLAAKIGRLDDARLDSLLRLLDES